MSGSLPQRAMRNPRVLIIGFVVLAAMSWIVYNQTHMPDNPVIGKRAPDFTVVGLDGNDMKLSDFRGRPVILNFWATWCGPCRHEMPRLERLYADDESDYVVLAVSMGELPDTVRQYIERYEYTFPVGLDRNQAVGITYLVRALPSTFFIDRRGILHAIYAGEISETTLHSLAKQIYQ